MEALAEYGVLGVSLAAAFAFIKKLLDIVHESAKAKVRSEKKSSQSNTQVAVDHGPAIARLEEQHAAMIRSADAQVEAIGHALEKLGDLNHRVKAVEKSVDRVSDDVNGIRRSVNNIAPTLRDVVEEALLRGVS